MAVSMEHYRVFYQVARCGNITQAAAALYSSQPNVTHAVKLLEEELGCKLFLRTNKGVQLTPEGEVLYAHVAQAAYSGGFPVFVSAWRTARWARTLWET